MKMAHPSDNRSCNPGFMRLILLLVAVFLVGYTLRLPMFWRFKEHSRVLQASCPLCNCDCSPATTLSLPSGFVNSSFSDCGKDDPEMNEEMKKDIITLLSEEITLQKTVANDSLEHTKALIMDARKTSSHYQREAEKCNVGMEYCEETREKAEAALIEERKLSELWEQRAREYGWKDERRVYL